MSYAEVNGLSLYFEEHGSGEPLVLLHGGIGAGEMFAPILPALAERRRVILVDLQGHGRTADVDRPLRPELMADDIVALIKHLGLARADMMGYSLGADVALRATVQHPHAVRRLVLVSTPFKRAGWHPEVVAAMDRMSAETAEAMKHSPIYELYSRLAPRPQDWPVLIGKIAELKKQDYDWSAEISSITAPALLVFGDADAVRPEHMMEFYGLLGGGLRDAGWDGAGRSIARLAVLPGATHYDILTAPGLAATVLPFLDS
ncbi:alpha/beta fold hydrolase [Streptosporangium roseum]|uniref:Alpha/beta hydrolase fold protein n=1 Tax=Streptosporangium roseum (strain ATCC 12428 / DSM 43021 / JCM 3005 / KCTC 9067 / NCIMB 10171 / NRRL 2505 / NI 9100) TaxID=479432 RepID=D2BEG3_STRRD|nr:alpha/beta hydrolase [Streptosporangium roseum]ACZ92000.1 alpha/beta hydrolase fold protein [Streptosporangium roseum DSM 43021]